MTADSSAICVVVDTNVLAVAEGLYPAASEECRAACAKLAGQIQRGLIVAVDSEVSNEAILSEYLSTLRASKLSGVGSKLAISLWRRRRDPNVCRVVHITPCDTPPGSFEEVPATLDDFDVDDHKWVAVALADGSRPQVFQAQDQEWWQRRQDLFDAGVDVQFLCVSDLMEST